METRYRPDLVRDFVTRVFQSGGAEEAWSRSTAEIIVTADLWGVQTHGVERMHDYCNAIKNGKIKPAAKPEILRESPVSALVDAHEGLGHSAAKWCMELAIRKAKENGVGIVSLRNGNHYGVAGYYPLMAVREHLIGLSVTNTEGLMVPTGSKEPLLGSNPIAFGMHAKPYPFLLDMSTTVIPGGRLALYSRDGKELQPGWGLGLEGQPTLDPGEVRAGINSKRLGGILPLGGLGELYGGHKGYGLAMMVEVLGSILSGGDTSNLIRRLDPNVDRNGEFFLALDYGLFGDKAEMEQRLGDYMHTLRTSERFDPDTPIYTHGEKELRNLGRNEQRGIHIRDLTLAEQLEVGRRMGFDAQPYFVPVPAHR